MQAQNTSSSCAQHHIHVHKSHQEVPLILDQISLLLWVTRWALNCDHDALLATQNSNILPIGTSPLYIPCEPAQSHYKPLHCVFSIEKTHTDWNFQWGRINPATYEENAALSKKIVQVIVFAQKPTIGLKEWKTIPPINTWYSRNWKIIVICRHRPWWCFTICNACIHSGSFWT